jgi:hypothetical protein
VDRERKLLNNVDDSSALSGVARSVPEGSRAGSQLSCSALQAIAAYATTGRLAEAVSEFEKAFKRPIPASPDAKGYLQLAPAMNDSDRSGASAVAAALCGDRDEVFRYLEKAYADGDNELLMVIRYPALDPLRSDPRYADLMRRLGLPE